MNRENPSESHSFGVTSANAVVIEEITALIERCPTPACLACGRSGKLIASNREFLGISGLGFDPELADHNFILRVTSPEDDAEEDLSKLGTFGDPRPIRVRYSVDGGPGRDALAAFSRINLNGHPHVAVFIDHNVDRKNTELTLAQARDAALETARLKSEFLANISHEIRTPLNGIIGMTCLLRDTKLTSLQRSFAETIRISADNLLTIINEILDFSKLEAGKLQVECEPFDLRATIEGTLDLLAERAQSKGLEITSLIHKEAPCALLGDAGRIRQVLTNLIGNAIKFTERGEVFLEVRLLRIEGETHELQFSVFDSGIGIPEASRATLFEAFQQAESSTARKYGGTGLGLAISKQLVEAMGGSIGINPRENHGSEFWFTLPFKTHDLQQPNPAAEVAAKLAGLNILLVEPNDTTARHLQYLFSLWGARSTRAVTAVDALSHLRQDRRFDLAMITMLLEGMDGLSLARSIKADPSISGTRLLMMTTLSHQVETNLLHAANIGACLTKPLKQSKLADYVAAAMTDNPPARNLGGPLHLPSEPLHSTLTPPQRPIRVMIAEDNPINQKVAKGLLARFGYPSEVIPDGKRLLQALDLAPCDIIFMDCQLPELDGYEATRQIRRREESAADEHRTYVIALTADAVQGAREKCLRAGMNDYISKPIRVEELQAVMRRAIQHVNLSAPTPDNRAPSGYLDQGVMETLRMLRSPNQPDPVPPLIDEFIQSAEEQLAALSAALKGDDFVETGRCAHRLNGGCCGIGALRLAGLSRELEAISEKRDSAAAQSLMSQIEGEYTRVKAALEFEKLR